MWALPRSTVILLFSLFHLSVSLLLFQAPQALFLQLGLDLGRAMNFWGLTFTGASLDCADETPAGCGCMGYNNAMHATDLTHCEGCKCGVRAFMDKLPVYPLILAPVKGAAAGGLAGAFFACSINQCDMPLRPSRKGLHNQVPVVVSEHCHVGN